MTSKLRVALALVIGLTLGEIGEPTLAWALDFLTHPQVMSRVSLRF